MADRRQDLAAGAGDAGCTHSIVLPAAPPVPAGCSARVTALDMLGQEPGQLPLSLCDASGREVRLSPEERARRHNELRATLQRDIGRVRTAVAGFREQLATLRSNNQAETNPLDFPIATRRLTALEARVPALEAQLAAGSWGDLERGLVAAHAEARSLSSFINLNIRDDTTIAEFAQFGLEVVRNQALLVFGAAAVAVAGGVTLGAVAVTATAGAVINGFGQLSEQAAGLRQEVSGAEIGGAALYAALDVLLAELAGGRAASGVAQWTIREVETTLIMNGVGAERARSIAMSAARWVVGRLLAGARAVGEAGIRGATRPSSQGTSGSWAEGAGPPTSSSGAGASRPGTTTPSGALASPGTALLGGSGAPQAVIDWLDSHGLDDMVADYARTQVNGIGRTGADQIQGRDRRALDRASAGHETAVRRAAFATPRATTPSPSP
jgi:hypothetical protein